MLKHITTAVLVGLSLVGSAQHLSIPQSPTSLSDTTSVSVNLKGSSYFYNYEYFEETAKGFTQPGFSLVPTVQANLGSKLLIGGGIHLKKYWGDKPFGEVEPVVFARYEALKNFFVQVGTLENGDRHMLSDVLYNPLHAIDYRQENGLQLRYYGSRIFADAWVSWENYIKEGDKDQERLTAGGSILLQLTPEQSQWEVIIPIQATFKHIGGQINDKNDKKMKVRTLSNLSLGLQAAYKYNSKGDKVGLLLQPIKFNDSYAFKPFEGNSGNGALSATAFLATTSLDVKLGYLYGKHFYSILGDPIYNNITIDYSTIEKTRSLYSATGSFHKEVYKGVQLLFDAGAYYTSVSSDINYYYGVGLKVQMSRMIKW